MKKDRTTNVIAGMVVIAAGIYLFPIFPPVGIICIVIGAASMLF